MIELGVSLFGLSMRNTYEDENGFINTMRLLSKYVNVFEIPLVPFRWLPYISKYVEENGVIIYSVHMPKDFFELNNSMKAIILKYAENIKKKMNITSFVFHPDINYSNQEWINLKKYDVTVAFELCNRALLSAPYLNDQNFMLVIDYSHLKRLNCNILAFNANKIGHAHIRGYETNVRYSRLKKSKDEIKIFVDGLKSINYSGKVFLEYPYENIEDIIEDYIILKEII